MCERHMKMQTCYRDRNRLWRQIRDIVMINRWREHRRCICGEDISWTVFPKITRHAGELIFRSFVVGWVELHRCLVGKIAKCPQRSSHMFFVGCPSPVLEVIISWTVITFICTRSWNTFISQSEIIRQQFYKWVATWQNQHGECAPSESSLSAWKNLGSLATHWAHSKDWSDGHADLSLCLAHTHFVGFVLLWLKCISFTLWNILSSEQSNFTWSVNGVGERFEVCSNGAGRKKTKMVAQPIYDKPLSMASYQNSRWHWNLVCSIWFYQIYSNVGSRLPFNLCQMSVWFLGFFTGKMPSSITQRLLKTIIQKVYMDRVKRFWYL